jgi:cobalt-zinc-cadmium resistance protein CzcA
MTFVPAAIALFVKGPISEHENKLMVLLRSMYRPLLSTALRLPLVVMILALVVLISAFWQAKQMGSEFLPKLDEGDVAMHAMRIVGTSLSQSVAMQQLIEQEIITLPQVLRVFSKIGTPEVATDPMPPNVADTFIILKPRAQWPDPTLTREQLVNQIREKVTPLPGNNYEFTQPIEMRFNELIAGVRSDIAVRVYGDDLETLQQVGKQLTKVLESVAGTKDVAMEQAAGLPVISITPKAEHLALAGMDVATMQQVLQNAVGGQQVGVIFEGDKRFNLVVRLPENQRSNIEALGRIPIALAQEGHAELQFLPLAEVASLTEQIGPNQINRESGKRNVVITANVSGRDLGSVISDIQQKMAAVSLPPGYWLDYGGTFKQLQSATARLTLVVPLTLLLILLMLYSALNNWRDTLVVFSGVPFALCGGVFALLLRDMPISISAAVGFIALCGIAVLNGIVMVSFIRQLQYQGQSLDEAIMSGAMSRLRPVLMTALVASLGFIPMAFNIGTGAEIQRPLATVVIGGIVSSTLLTLLVLPAIYRLAERLRIK